eukprot:CAMPEP_0176425996 /NCGR_PEP_ID=MMETSP0127-20121128/11694_1 /TAXON_ID=938130 /ORGANISM="Platyophrya macrostoma, Strain WH" /LENGTH=378 /DNA_ID=CAMNT_0017807209 /DNA_START=34 /DNA_END=1166 /DNA_ORIENTATION=-
MPAESRSELLQWFNSVLPESLLQCIGGELTRIEQCGSGIPYLFVLPKLFPQSPVAAAAPSKAKLPARQDYESCCNLKILQDVFAKNHVEPRCLEIDRMAKRNFQANLEFLQWFKHLCDVRGVQRDDIMDDERLSTPPTSTAAADAMMADPSPGLQRRTVSSGGHGSSNQLMKLSALSNPPSPGANGASSRRDAASSSAGVVRSIRPPNRIVIPAAPGLSPQPSSRSMGAASTSSIAYSATGGGIVRSSAPSVAVGGGEAVVGRTPNSSSRLVSPVRRSKSPVAAVSPFGSSVSRSLTPTAALRPTSRSGSSSRVGGNAASASSAAAAADQALLSSVDLERRFYYDKLRRIEDLIHHVTETSSQGTLATQIRSILYATS